MAHKVVSDEELLMLLSPIDENQETNLTEKPKLTMKLLFELIKKLKEENIVLSNRVTEYELKLELHLQTKAEIASTLEVPDHIEPVSTFQMNNELERVLPHTALAPRSVRHPSHRKKPIWILFIKEAARYFVRRRKIFIHTPKNGF
ncbi:hypothetical protein [Paenibacillus planticolens]|uniref:Uncharacterized protein n=1 Tax=Paenibacillus planticolens TaxID=2654976 RepID=A0ABX1ZW80_9BACL|nr:hypothetical protein [Paenibacillus planticolens]NOV03063.1 hypothetical protein [Paenibacillus planticolens]